MKRHFIISLIRLLVLVGFCAASGSQSRAQTIEGSGNIPHSPGLASYSRGLALYANGDYQSAAGAFQEALRLNAAIKAARYWLGMCYYQQNRLSEAKEQFTSLTGTFSSYAKAYDGLGLVLLKETNRSFEALEAFRQAAVLDPTDAAAFYHMGLAYMQLMTHGPLGEHPYVSKARQSFQHALELNPNHPDAWYQLGRLSEGMSGGSYVPSHSDSFYHIGLAPGASEAALDDAVIAYARQLTANPNHEDAIHALGLLQSRRGHHQEASRLLQAVVDQHPADAALLMDLALAYWRAKDWNKAHATFERLIPLLPARERALYSDLTLVARPAEAQHYAQAPDAKKQQIWQTFWAARDPIPLTAVNERLVEHYARIAYARREYGQVHFPWDRRGEIIIRYGLPDQVFQSRTSSVITEFPIIEDTFGPERVTWRETWTYLNLPMTLTFENDMNSRQYDYPPFFAMYGDLKEIHYTHPYYVSRRVIAKTPEQHIPRELGLPLAFVYDAVAFRDDDGHTRLEVAYGLPSSEIGPTGDSLTGRTLESGVVLYGKEWTRVAVDSSRIVLVVPSNLRSTVHAVAVQGFTAPPGAYQMAVQVHDRAAYRFGMQRSPIQIPNLQGSGLRMSGIRLASDVQPAGPQPDGLVWHGMRIVPNPARTYARGDPVHLYVEIYNLTLNPSSQPRYQIDVAVRTEVDSLQAQHPVWQALSGLEKRMRRERQRTVTMTFDGTGRDADQAWHTALDTAEMTAGTYTVTVTVTDLTTGSTAAQERRFWVKDTRPGVTQR